MKKYKIFGNVHNMHYSMNFRKTNSMYVILNIITIERGVCVCVCVGKRERKENKHKKVVCRVA